MHTGQSQISLGGEIFLFRDIVVHYQGIEIGGSTFIFLNAYENIGFQKQDVIEEVPVVAQLFGFVKHKNSLEIIAAVKEKNGFNILVNRMAVRIFQAIEQNRGPVPVKQGSFPFVELHIQLSKKVVAIYQCFFVFIFLCYGGCPV